MSQRPAREQPEHAAAGAAFVERLLQLGAVGRGHAGGRAGAGLEGRVQLERRVAAGAADERGDDPLVLRDDVAERGDDLRRGRLRHQQQRLGLVVLGEQPDRLAEHDPADRGRQVAAADPDDVRHAAARGVDEAGDLLGARPGRGDDADRPAPDDVDEAEPDLAEHRRAAARAHDEQAAVAPAALQLDLLLDRHVVGEHERVQPARQRLVGGERGELAGHRHERDRRAVEPRGGGGQRARRGRTGVAAARGRSAAPGR